MSGTPAIPETFESRQERTARRIHPRQFINENNHTLAIVQFLEQLRQLVKSLHPRLRLFKPLKTVIQQRIVETLQLGLHSVLFILLVNWRYTSVLKGEFILQCLFDKERLADSPSAIYCYKFCTITIVEPFQLFYLLFPSNNCTHNYYILPQR